MHLGVSQQPLYQPVDFLHLSQIPPSPEKQDSPKMRLQDLLVSLPESDVDGEEYYQAYKAFILRSARSSCPHLSLDLSQLDPEDNEDVCSALEGYGASLRCLEINMPDGELSLYLWLPKGL